MALFSKLNQKITTEEIKSESKQDSILEEELIFGTIIENCIDIVDLNEVSMSDVIRARAEQRKEEQRKYQR